MRRPAPVSHQHRKAEKAATPPGTEKSDKLAPADRVSLIEPYRRHAGRSQKVPPGSRVGLGGAAMIGRRMISRQQC